IRDFHVTGVQTCALPISGELGPVREAGAVSDLSQDPGPGAGTDPGQAHQQLSERVGQEDLLDLGGEGVAAFVDAVELTGELGDQIGRASGRERYGRWRDW